MEKAEQNQKVLAVFLLLFLMLVYKQTIWDPFFGQKFPAPSSSSSTKPTVDTPATAAKPEEKFAEAAPAAANPSAPAEAAESSPAVSAEPTASQAAPVASTEAPAARPYYPNDAQIVAGGIVTAATTKLEVDISLLGGRFTALKLLDYKQTIDAKSPPLDLVRHVESAPYPLGVYSGPLNDNWVEYELKGGSLGQDKHLQLDLASAESSPVTLVGKFPDGRTITKTLTFHREGYFVDIAVALEGTAQQNERMQLEWTELVSPKDPTFLDPYNTSGYVWFDGERAERLNFSKFPIDEKTKQPVPPTLGNVQWISMADKYFMAAILNPDGASPAEVLKTAELYRARMAGSDNAIAFRVAASPKSYELLRDMDHELHRNIDFGKLGFVSAPMLALLHFFFDLVGNYGLAIILLTIVVKAALYPLNASAYSQMKGMQKLAPEMKRLREQVRDKQQQQMEMMALYKREGVNPMGGCLPMLLQFPILIGLYYGLLLEVSLRHAPFALWIHDLSDKEQLMIGGYSIPVMVILMCLTMLIQQLTTPTTADPAQKRMMMFMPVMFFFLFKSFPSGLTLYYLTNNIISIAQQRAMNSDRGPRFAVRVTALVSFCCFAVGALLVAVS